jgi:hypothetical protein
LAFTKGHVLRFQIGLRREQHLMTCQERERLAAAYLAAVAETNESGNVEASVDGNGRHEAGDDKAVLLALNDHQVEQGC